MDVHMSICLDHKEYQPRCNACAYNHVGEYEKLKAELESYKKFYLDVFGALCLSSTVQQHKKIHEAFAELDTKFPKRS